jgi:hypothetical protein
LTLIGKNIKFVGNTEDLHQEHWNVRYLASRVDQHPQTWAATVQKRTGIPLYRAEKILHGAPIKREEIDAIAAAFDTDVKELQSNPLYGHGNESVLRLNLRYLIKPLPQGGQKNLAKSLGVTHETPNRWISQGSSRRPSRKNQSRLLRYFGLDPELDLAKEPVFLSMAPVGAHLQKAWLLERVKEMPPEEIAKIFPAVQRIFRKDETD